MRQRILRNERYHFRHEPSSSQSLSTTSITIKIHVIQNTKNEEPIHYSNYNIVAFKSCTFPKFFGITTKKESATRVFRLIPYGSSVPDNLENTISCDGRIPGTCLELTHWNGNETPDELYADTSTEMALKFALVSNEYDYLPNKEVPATILNNHYDTDGVLSVWTCLEPELALNHQDLLISAAEAGDFAEWTSDDGVKLNFALDAIASSASDDEEKAYELAVKELPNLLKDFETNQGANYENLWKDSFQALQDEWNEVRDQKKAHVSKASSDFIVTLNESEGVSTLSPLVLYRAMKDKGIWKDTTRILHVYEPSHGTYQYSYEKIGHGWVGKLVERHVVPNVDADCLVKQLNEHLEGFCWKKGGPGDSMLAICTTTTNVTVPPEEIVMLLDAIETQIATDIKV